MVYTKLKYFIWIMKVTLFVACMTSCKSIRLDEEISCNEKNIVYFTKKLSIFHDILIEASSKNYFWVVYEGPLKHDSARELRKRGWRAKTPRSEVIWFIYTTRGEDYISLTVDRHLAVIELIDFVIQENKYIVNINHFHGTNLDFHNLIRSFEKFNIIVNNESDFF